MVCVSVSETIHSLKLVDYLSVQTHKQYNNLHLFFQTWDGSLYILRGRHFTFSNNRMFRIFLVSTNSVLDPDEMPQSI